MEFQKCVACPRKCGINRENSKGFCGVGSLPKIARAALHFWEEPCISGKNGSGTVFFSGCNLRCVFCQNKEISRDCFGKEITEKELRNLFESLAEQGAHNINLVTPSHYISLISRVLEKPIGIPVIYNCGGYDDVESLKTLDGKIDIYMPDMKYRNAAAAKRYSGAPDYPDVAAAAIKEMYRQTGGVVFDNDGMLRRGLLIRHLMLPENKENTYSVIEWVCESFPKRDVLFSLMSQYVPHGDLAEFPEINRRLSEIECEEMENYLYLTGLTNGYIQRIASANEEYIPDFDLTGVE